MSKFSHVSVFFISPLLTCLISIISDSSSHSGSQEFGNQSSFHSTTCSLLLLNRRWCSLRLKESRSSELRLGLLSRLSSSTKQSLESSLLRSRWCWSSSCLSSAKKSCKVHAISRVSCRLSSWLWSLFLLSLGEYSLQLG